MAKRTKTSVVPCSNPLRSLFQHLGWTTIDVLCPFLTNHETACLASCFGVKLPKLANPNPNPNPASGLMAKHIAKWRWPPPRNWWRLSSLGLHDVELGSGLLHMVPKGTCSITCLNLSRNRLLTPENGRLLGKALQCLPTMVCLVASDIGEGMVESQKDGVGFLCALSPYLADFLQMRGRHQQQRNTRSSFRLDIRRNSLCRGQPKRWPGRFVPANVGYRFEHEWGTHDYDYHCDVQGIAALSSALQSMPCARKHHPPPLVVDLNLDGNYVGRRELPKGWKSKDDDDVAPWVHVSEGECQLHHPGEPQGVILLAELLRRSHLRELTLGNSNIDSLACEALATNLVGNTTVTKLDLSHNMGRAWTDNAIQHLMAAVAGCRCVTRVGQTACALT